MKNQKAIGIVSKQQETLTMDIAVPIGVIAAFISFTSPIANTIYNTLIALKSGNAIIISPHPAAKKCIQKTVRILHNAAVAAGAPVGIIGCMTELSIEGSKHLMKGKSTSLIIATGSKSMATIAYHSWTPAIATTQENCPCCYIENSANISDAVQKVVMKELVALGGYKKQFAMSVIIQVKQLKSWE